MNPLHPDPRVQKIVHFYEHLSPASLAHIAGIYTENAQFKDPFHAVEGIAAISHIFTHMFQALQEPRFIVQSAILESQRLCLTWDFHFSRKGLARPMHIHGASVLTLDPDGRIRIHRDYWDTAEELYSKIPLLGAAIRFITKKLQSPPQTSA